MKYREVLVIGTMLVVGMLEVAFHWLLLRESFAPLLAVYLSTDAGGKYFYAGVVDSTLPAIVLGSVNGWAGYPKWSIFRLGAMAFLIAICVAEMTSVYAAVIGPGAAAIVYGSLKGAPGNVLFRVLSSFFVAGIFTYGAYVFRRDWKRGKG